MTQPLIRRRASEQGYILISTIIMVLLITLLAFAGISFNSTQTRMATNSKDGQIALQSAEGALRQLSVIVASGFVNTPCLNPATVAITSGQLNTTCVGTSNQTPLWQAAGTTWFTALPSGTIYQGDSSTTPSYIIEQLPPTYVPAYGSNPLYGIRITVRASGAISTTPQVMLQTVVMIPFH